MAKEILLAGTVLRADRALAVGLITEVHDADRLMDAAHDLADRIGRQDPLAVRITKSVFHAPCRGAPAERIAGHSILRTCAGFDRMQAFLDKKNAKKNAKTSATATASTPH